MSHNVKARKKVLIVYPFFMHYRQPVIEELIANGKHLYFFAGDLKAKNNAIEACQISDASRYIRVKSYYLGSMLLQPGLLMLLLKKKFDCVILLGNATWPFTWLAACLSRLMGKRTLFWTHGWLKKEQGLVALIRNTLYGLSHGLLLYGHTAKRIGVSSGFPPDSLYVVYNALDYDRQNQILSEITTKQIDQVKSLFDRPDQPIVVCCSRLTPQRRLDLLLEAIVQLRKDGYAVNVLLIGDGPERERLEANAKENHLPVHFFGACYDESRLAAMTKAAAVTVAPGKVGLTAIQSLTFETPVITHGNPDTQMPEFESVIPGVNGDYFEENNVSDLARVIKKWTSNVEKRNGKQISKIVEERYTPTIQRVLFDGAVSGTKAAELPFQDEPC